jgi:pimeloyl-ACP methyl ester carboxylesterase
MHLTTSTTGTGPRHVALVHGLGGNGATWAPLIERMIATNRYTVTTVDLRGHGSSDRAPSYALDELAADLVENLPHGLDSVVGHSLGGSVLVRAVGRLAPARAIYLDPGFHLTLPTTGLRGRLFWVAPLVTLGFAQLRQSRQSAAAKALYTPAVRESIARAQREFDRGMAIGVFRDVAFHPIAPAAPEVPSTIVLSDDSPAVLSDTLAAELERLGWDIRRLPRVHHDMQLENPDGTFQMIEDVL